MAGVELKNVIKKYGQVQVIHGIDLSIDDGEFCVFVGPSGCVRDNMGFGLKMNGHPKSVITEKVAEATRILKLEPYLDRKPAALR